MGLESVGTVSLGAVSGANKFFALSDDTRQEYDLDPTDQLVRISPPGTRHLNGTTFSRANWEKLREAGERVWLLHPDPQDQSPGLKRYIQTGRNEGVDQAYKCRVREPWWRPPIAAPPDLFFTYMSHRFPRLINNTAKVSILNSIHGLWLAKESPAWLRQALPLLALNSVTLLGAEVHGRSYGGGILKMEPREAADLPIPKLEHLEQAWQALQAERTGLQTQLRNGRWTTVLARIDRVLLHQVIGLSLEDVDAIHLAAQALRERRMNR